MIFEGFIVSYSGEENVCLSNDERLLVQDFTVEAPQVTHSIYYVRCHQSRLIYLLNRWPFFSVDHPEQLHVGGATVRRPLLAKPRQPHQEQF